MKTHCVKTAYVGIGQQWLLWGMGRHSAKQKGTTAEGSKAADWPSPKSCRPCGNSFGRGGDVIFSLIAWRFRNYNSKSAAHYSGYFLIQLCIRVFTQSA